MTEEKFEMFRNRLTKVARHTGKQARKQDVSCYRVYDHDLPEFPMCIEIYEDRGYIAEYKRQHRMSEEIHNTWLTKSIEVISDVLAIPKDLLFSKLRQRKPGRTGQYKKLDEQQNEIIVVENNLKFIVNLSDYLDTGLFLDHRLTRQMVREKSRNKKVLNLFAYTGSFSVYAAGGGAEKVITVDLSNTYLDWAKRNMALNGFIDEQRYHFIHADVKEYLQSLPAESFDIIVVDPPTFSNSKRMTEYFDIQKDHVVMINQCLRALRPGGIIYFSTNSKTFRMEQEKIVASAIKDITKATTPFDFEGKLSRWCFRISK